MTACSGASSGKIGRAQCGSQQPAGTVVDLARMYGHTYALRPYDATPELDRATAIVRQFLYRYPDLHARVRYEEFARFAGRDPNPQGIVQQALRADVSSSNVCTVIASPIGQVAVLALRLEFPGWGLVFDLLPVAAQAICAERRQESTMVAVSGIALFAGVCLVLYALSGKPPKV